MKKDLLIIILVVLLAACVGVGSFYVFKSLDDKPENGNENTPKPNQNPNNVPGIVDITNTSLATELEKKLTTSDNGYGMYFLDKVSITDTTNLNLLSFNFRQYFLDNKLNANLRDGETVTISKNDFNNYMNKKYNTNSTYNVNLTEENGIEAGGLNFRVPVYVRSEDNNYVYYGKVQSGHSTKVLNKLVKAEQEKDYIYLYDKALYVSEGQGNFLYFSTTYTISYLSKDLPERIYECNTNYEKCYTIDQVFNNYEDKLHTFKHTFKKGTDNNYYWVSSEISK